MNPRARLLSSVPFPTAAQGRNQQCPTGSLPNTAQEVAGCFCHKGSCSAWCPPGPPCQAPFLSVTLSLPWCLRYPQGQDWAFPFVQLHVIPVIPCSQPVDVPMNGTTSACCISCCSQLWILCRLAGGALCSAPSTRSLMKVTNHPSPSHLLGYKMLFYIII